MSHRQPHKHVPVLGSVVVFSNFERKICEFGAGLCVALGRIHKPGPGDHVCLCLAGDWLYKSSIFKR